MKKTLSIISLIFLGTFVHAQNGLENIVVEKYYVSDYNDSIGNDVISANPGALPVGSVTYRIYVDMLPGYKFQAAYGVNTPGDTHDFRISTTTLFFNNEDRGATTPNAINNNFVSHNTVMLDSWLSVGAASSTKSGIMKIYDDGVNNVANINSLLQNNNTSAGIPLTVQDGFIAVTPQPVTLVGISNDVLVFDNQNDGTNGPLFHTDNGSLACLNGATGPDSIDNKVLIAQITTNGDLCFELNIQIGTPTGGVENYVAQNPVGPELSIPSLMYCSNTVGVDELEDASSSFMILSNPTKDFFTLEITPAAPTTRNSYAIYDVNGKRINIKKIDPIQSKYFKTVDISTLPAGQYFVEVTLDGISTAKKIVKN